MTIYIKWPLSWSVWHGILSIHWHPPLRGRKLTTAFFLKKPKLVNPVLKKPAAKKSTQLHLDFVSFLVLLSTSPEFYSQSKKMLDSCNNGHQLLQLFASEFFCIHSDKDNMMLTIAISIFVFELLTENPVLVCVSTAFSEQFWKFSPSFQDS